ncbi:pyruvate:ferredoxin (flavodoxin) oxidoreductase [Candidatus Xianfuyuplasma coldseepsis]|uniref:Pyruvate:ferredoxin (Flavodoxin) oxidoreductase n=1 Tax=Candidatus Xianfuyuplasma coldseepsis TaxID=2782163 RepID=A0A7L7KNV8_9MOLU|nr:pyruvate:ferredoxin (flavodoxin) oxidoreductase [Xianfuyuplasma coldseepsis]QMS84451.1 pyruvate:ferredoxin (flavodoxin) oxidoreductase [Xianfuyuplasma coldseepsis]
MAKKVFQSMDGNQAAAYCAYAFTEVAGIYPITPSSPMAEHIDLWASQGKKNLFDMPVKVIEMQSEGGAAGTVHGSLQAGALTTTFTASQGLLLKLPNMYKIAGELLPGVIHVAARSIAVQALSIFGDHQDVMAARPTGFAILASGSVQEVMDLAGVAHLSAIESSIPFLHFFDGFRTSHEVNKIEVMDYEVFDKLLNRDAVKEFRKNALNSANPVTRGSAQNDDVYMQAREIQDKYYAEVPDIAAKYLAEISKITGREYAPFVYYGDNEATEVVVAMGSVTEAIEETVDYLNNNGRKVGLLTVHLYRPFSAEFLLQAMPKTVKAIAVLDRTKESGSVGEPLYLDVKAVYYGQENAPLILGGRYGLSSKDTTPGQIVAVFDNLVGDKRDRFTIGINDDVNFTSLPEVDVDVQSEGTTELLFFGFGSDGTVGASKNTIKIIGENTDLYGQAYSSYDSKKSGGVTRMHLRFGKDPIRSTYLVNKPHFVSCSKDSYLTQYDMVGGLRDGGTFLLNTVTPADEVEALLPNKVKKQLAEKDAKLYIINAVKLAEEAGLTGRTNTIMQSAFFSLNEQIMPYETAQKLMKKYAEKTYGRKGQDIVENNYKAIDMGQSGLVQIDVKPEWKDLKVTAPTVDTTKPVYVRDIADQVNAIKGYDLPVSAFEGREDGSMDNGSTAYEKRGIADYVPQWLDDNCIQCNQCAFACPHAVIRPFLLTDDEMEAAPDGLTTVKARGKGLEGLQYKIQISTLDCTGCGVCVEVCPAKTKALAMSPIGDEIEKGEVQNSEYLFNEVTYKDNLVSKTNAKNSQFAKPLFEFSGACAGCGETPYIKLVTQLFGERMQIANATGCSSIYGASFPATPFTTLDNGRGPAWANSLFEDNAEFGFGMFHANETLRDRLQNIFVNSKDKASKEEAELFEEWLENRSDGEKTLEISKKLLPLLEDNNKEYAEEIKELANYIVKQSNWIIGGDGWAYDIGYGGLDHVIANGEDVNILVLDTEVYSNTGGQSSKSAPKGSIAKFTASGKGGKKKDLAAIAMTYGDVYVAQVSHGASQPQVIKAFLEAEAYPGPSIIVAYSPCIAHKIKGGLTNSQNQAKLATQSGYWPTFRYDPTLEPQGKNPFQIDCKEPNWDLYPEFLDNEARYAQLKDINPEHADELLAGNLSEAKRRWDMYKRYAAMDYSNAE